jgi:hypothetical protein
MRQAREDDFGSVNLSESRRRKEIDRKQRRTKRSERHCKSTDAGEEWGHNRKRRMKETVHKERSDKSNEGFTEAIPLADASAPPSHHSARTEQPRFEAFMRTIIVVQDMLEQTQKTEDLQEMKKFVEFSITALEYVIRDFGPVMTKRVREVDSDTL